MKALKVIQDPISNFDATSSFIAGKKVSITIFQSGIIQF